MRIIDPPLNGVLPGGVGAITIMATSCTDPHAAPGWRGVL